MISGRAGHRQPRRLRPPPPSTKMLRPYRTLKTGIEPGELHGMKRRLAIIVLVSGFGLGSPSQPRAQTIEAEPPVVDTIIILTQNVFPPETAEKNFAFRFMNAIHITTKRDFIWRELLFRPGEPYDSVKVEESERNLRAREIFREIDIDSLRLPDGRLAVVVDTWDGWSTKPKFKLTIASDGTWTGQFGLTEINLLGSGNLAHIAYRKDVDRDGLELIGDFRRMLGSRVGVSGNVIFWDDGTEGYWRFGVPFLTTLDRTMLEHDGEAANQRVLQYFVDDPAAPDTAFYQRDAQIVRLTGALATIAETQRYLRVGLKGEVRQEKFVTREADEEPDLDLVPDSVYGLVGAYGEYSQTRFKEVRYFNGFGSEDIDLSTRLSVTAYLAPSGWGYEETGIGPRLSAQTGYRSAAWFLQTKLDANGLFTDAGLDSGRVVLDLTFGLKPAPRHSTAVYVTAGWQEDVRPGDEFDLGFETPPRSWEPHSFVGTRMVWGTVEHRWYPLEALLELVSLGFAAFIDYGGAWYPGQDERFGGNIGIGLRQGGSLSTAARTGRLDLGYRFGEGVTGDRWVLTFGAGFVFPWNPSAGEVGATR